MTLRSRPVSNAVRVFENAHYPGGLTVNTAWLGIYQTLLWYEPVNWVGFVELPHIIDSDKLRPSRPPGAGAWTAPNVWQQRALAITEYLAQQLQCPVAEVPNKVDLLMKLPLYRGMQRQNILGNGFVQLIAHVLETFGSSGAQYSTEVSAATIFPGVTVPGRSAAPSLDVLVSVGGIPRAVISVKWSLRHDRVGDITNECPVYKAAYNRIHRQTRSGGLLYYVVTNEYDPARLGKMLSDSCVDGVVHVHRPAVVTVCGLNGRLGQLLDLTDLITAATTW